MTSTGSARKYATSNSNPLEVPADHVMFVKRRGCFVPARRHPVDHLDWGSQLDPEESREKEGVKIGPIEPVPPSDPSVKIVVNGERSSPEPSQANAFGM